VARRLEAAHPGIAVELVEIDSSGDLDRTSPVAALTEMGAFVRSVQAAVLDGRADAAIHSLKDLPTAPMPGLMPIAFPERAEPWDVMVGSTLDALPGGATVGTGSPRRAAQLRALRPDLHTAEIRGNVDTRLRKIGEGEVAAAVLAAAGLQRLGRDEVIDEVFDLAAMVPAPGQGVIVIETREGDPAADLLRRIDDPELRVLAGAERLLLAETGAGCRSALGALATRAGDVIRLDAFVDDERGPRRAAVAAETPGEVVAAARKELEL
jgi:hydroxymethylbilane synthase